MKPQLIFTATLLLGTLSGCANESGARMGLLSANAPVVAILSDDLFVGEAIGYMDRTGTINITSVINSELKCVGNFRYTGSKIGEGTMNCSDGNEARFQFNALSMLSGYGYGNSSRGGVSFTFGLTAEEASKYLKLPSGKKLGTNRKGKAELTQI